MLTNERIDEIAGPADYWDRRVFARAVEAAAVSPLLERIAALEAKLAQRVPPCRVADRGFRWDGDRQEHVPKLVIEFDAVPHNGPADSKGWVDRDALDALLSATPAAPEQQEPMICAECGGVLGHSRMCSKFPGYGGWVAQAPNAQQAEAQEPVEYQFQDRNGKWYWFMDERHRLNTIADGTWPIRPLFTRPQPAQLQALSEEEIVTAWRGVKDVGDDKYNAILLSEAVQSALAAKNGAVLK